MRSQSSAPPPLLMVLRELSNVYHYKEIIYMHISSIDALRLTSTCTKHLHTPEEQCHCSGLLPFYHYVQVDSEAHRAPMDGSPTVV